MGFLKLYYILYCDKNMTPLGINRKGRLLSDSNVFMHQIGRESIVLVSFTLIQTRVILEEGTSNEELPPSDYHVDMPVGIFLIND